MAYQRPKIKEIIARVENDYESRLGISEPARVSFVKAQARAFAGAAHGLYGYLDFIAKQAIPDTAEDEYLERWASNWKITRQPATFAAGEVQFSGSDSSVIPAGSVLQTSSGIQFTTDEDATIASGTATVAVTATQAGASGNVTTGTTISLQSPIIGVTSAATVQAPGITGGSDQESNDNLRSRLIARLQNPPQGGSAADYERWTLAAHPDVTRVWVVGRELGAGTVTVRFVTDDADTGLIPTQTVIDAVTEYIQLRRPVAADVYVVAPAQHTVNMSITLVPNTQVVRDAVTAELKDLFRREGEPGGQILLSRINEAISISEGEQDHTLTVPSANVQADPGAIPVLGTITWS